MAHSQRARAGELPPGGAGQGTAAGRAGEIGGGHSRGDNVTSSRGNAELYLAACARRRKSSRVWLSTEEIGVVDPFGRPTLGSPSSMPDAALAAALGAQHRPLHLLVAQVLLQRPGARPNERTLRRRKLSSQLAGRLATPHQLFVVSLRQVPDVRHFRLASMRPRLASRRPGRASRPPAGRISIMSSGAARL